MVANIHVNKAGETGVCGAVKGGCPFGAHYETHEQAREVYEKSQGGAAHSTLSKIPEFQPPLALDYVEDHHATYDSALRLAKALKTDNNFVVITSDYTGENLDRWEDDDDDDDDWGDSDSEEISTLSDMRESYPGGTVSHKAFSFDSREAFEDYVKREGLPGYGGSGEYDAKLDPENSSEFVYRSVPEQGVSNTNLARYSESNVFEKNPWT